MLLCIAAITAFGSEVPEYPYVITNPSSPVPGDTVTVSVVLGMSSNSCVPTFTSLEYELIPSAVTVFPPEVTMSISYEVNPPQGIVCSPAFTSYGPRYTLKGVSAGTYTVKRGDSILGAFSVSASPGPDLYTLSGKVLDDPFPQERLPLPIEGAKVYVLRPLVYILHDGGAEYSGQIVDSAVTDAGGTFAIQDLQSGSYTIVARAEGFRRKNVGIGLSKDTSVTVHLVPDDAVATVTGTVSHNNCPASGMMVPCITSPVPQCTVRVSLNKCPSFGGDPIGLWIPCETFTTVTDDEGRYRIDDIPISANDLPVTVSAGKERFVTKTKTTTLSNQQIVDMDFLLDRAYTNSHSREENGVVFKVATDKNVYSVGDNLKVRYSVHNTSDEEVSFGPHSSTCAYELTIDSEENGVRNISGHTICTDDFVYTIVEPGDSVVHEFSAYDITEVLSNPSLTAWVAGAENTQVSVGIEIEPATSTEPKNRVAGKAARSSIVATPEGKALRISLGRSQKIQVTGFSLNGRLFSIPGMNRNLPKGVHHLRLSNMAEGILLVRIKAEDFTETLRIPSLGTAR